MNWQSSSENFAHENSALKQLSDTFSGRFHMSYSDQHLPSPGTGKSEKGYRQGILEEIQRHWLQMSDAKAYWP